MVECPGQSKGGVPINDATTISIEPGLGKTAVAINPVNTPPLQQEIRGFSYRPYQSKGIDWLWSQKRAMLTDAPGLGKTMMALMAAVPPVLIVAPTYLTNQWRDVIKEHIPTRRVAVAKGNRDARTEVINDEQLDFLIVNKEMIRTHWRELDYAIDRFQTIIFDECHHLRNRTAKHSSGAVELAKQVPRVYLLSATPIWKEVDDLFMPLRIMHPDVFTSYWNFVDQWCIAETDRWGTKVKGVKKSMLKDLEILLDQVRLGRSYADAGRDLPPIIENIVKVGMEAPSRRFYDEIADGYRARIYNEPDMLMSTAMEVLHRLRQITGAEKVDAIVETVEDSRPYHEDKYVIFTWYEDTAWAISDKLPDALVVNGTYSPEERRQRALSGKPIIATIASLSEGIDLSHARMVIFAEEHWPPGSTVQALARVRRERNIPLTVPEDVKPSEWDNILSQLDSRQLNEEPILVYFHLVEDSVDDKIHAITQRRSATIREVMREVLDLYV